MQGRRLFLEVVATRGEIKYLTKSRVYCLENSFRQPYESRSTDPEFQTQT